MRVCASVKLWQRQSVSNSVFHLWNIKQVGRDERLLNSEKYTLIYYLQPFQWCLGSVLKKTKRGREKKPSCMSEQNGRHVLFSVQGFRGYIKYITMLPLFIFLWHFDMCVLALCKPFASWVKKQIVFIANVKSLYGEKYTYIIKAKFVMSHNGEKISTLTNDNAALMISHLYFT